MPDITYTVKVNRREGIVEISGPDKDWIADQLARLAVVYEQEVAERFDHQTADADGDTKPTRRSRRSARPSASKNGNEAPRRRTGAGTFVGKRVDELAEKLKPEARAALDKWVEERRSNFTDGPNQAAILSEFLRTEAQWEEVTPNDLYTVYDVMGWPGPNPRDALYNGQKRKNYFRSAGRGKFALSHTGQQFGRHGAKVTAGRDTP